MQLSYTKSGILGGDGVVFYNPLYDGGGTTIGYDMCKHPSILKHLSNINNTLEICSGPGFIGFYLLFNGLTKKLWLSDKFDGVLPDILKTNAFNQVDVKFIHSDCFQNFEKSLKFDLIISNPPHVQHDMEWIRDRKTEEEKHASYRINLDEDLKFHREFFENVKNHLHPGGKVILVENQTYISYATIMDLAGSGFECEVINGVYAEKNFYYIVLTLGTRD